MSETKINEHIEKKENGTGEYQALYLEGIEYLQQLCNEIWTDYNEHDPGVTILENLAYTATNLSYKVDLPLRDILTESKGAELVSGDNGFFISNKILTTNPITINDYRKIIIDRITNVKNVWIELSNNQTNIGSSKKLQPLNGLYEIFVEMSVYDKDPFKLEKEKKRITNDIRKLYLANRNLCEDLCTIKILKVLELEMHLTLKLKNDSNGEEILANIFYRVNDYLSHEVRFSSLSDLRNKERSVNSIFNGPFLKNGFIDNNELTTRKNIIDKTELLKLINSFEDVINIESFELINKKNSKKIFDKNNHYNLPPNKTTIIIIPKSDADLSFSDDDLTYRPDIRELNNLYSYIQSENYGSFKSTSKSINSVGIPKGNNLNISSYYSIREQFPLVYGINKFGLPRNLEPMRYAQANQLKGYLMPFDQLMCNFLAQLTNIYSLYDPKSHTFQSHFYQELDNMSNLTHLINSNKELTKKETLKEWASILQDLNSKLDPSAIERSNDIANHLMARFSESFPEYSLKKIYRESYGKSKDDLDFKKSSILSKRKLVANYAQLSYNRSRGYNYDLGYNQLKNEDQLKLLNNHLPGIIQKLCILMGIQNIPTRFISREIFQNQIKFYISKEKTEKENKKYLEISYSDKKEDIIVVNGSIEIKNLLKEVKEKFKYSGSFHNLFQKVLKKGVLHDNYSIAEIGSLSDKKYLNIKYPINHNHSVNIRFENYKINNHSPKEHAVNFFKKFSIESEGIHLIEHLLLAPPYSGKHFGYSFEIQLKQNITFRFEHQKLSKFAERNTYIARIIRAAKIKKGGLKFGYIEAHEKYYIEILKNSDSQILARGTKEYGDISSIRIDIQALNKKFQKKSAYKKIKKIKYYAYYKSERVNETFFSFKMSFVLPAWPVRFQHEDFRLKFNSILYDQCPVHIAHHSYWLDFDEFNEFEIMFFGWLKYKGINEKNLDLSYSLIKKLTKLHNKCHN